MYFVLWRILRADVLVKGLTLDGGSGGGGGERNSPRVHFLSDV